MRIYYNPILNILALGGELLLIDESTGEKIFSTDHVVISGDEAKFWFKTYEWVFIGEL